MRINTKTNRLCFHATLRPLRSLLLTFMPLPSHSKELLASWSKTAKDSDQAIVLAAKLSLWSALALTFRHKHEATECYHRLPLRPPPSPSAAPPTPPPGASHRRPHRHRHRHRPPPGASSRVGEASLGCAPAAASPRPRPRPRPALPANPPPPAPAPSDGSIEARDIDGAPIVPRARSPPAPPTRAAPRAPPPDARPLPPPVLPARRLRAGRTISRSPSSPPRVAPGEASRAGGPISSRDRAEIGRGRSAIESSSS